MKIVKSAFLCPIRPLWHGGIHKMPNKSKKQKQVQRKTGRKQTNTPKRIRQNVSAHAFLDPFYSSGHVPTHVAHAPYMMIESSRRWVQTLAANHNVLLCVCYTNTQCRGYVVDWTGAGDAVGYPILATQLSTVTPTHVALQRLGIQMQNITNNLGRSGTIYTLSCNDIVAVPFAADNVADLNIRIANADVVALANRITNSTKSRMTAATTSLQKKIKGLVTITNPDFVWNSYTDVDATLLTSNVDFETAIQLADSLNNTSAFLVYIPGQAIAQEYSFEVKSQDGCRFNVDHALFGSSKYAPMVPSHHIAQMYRAAHNSAHLGEHAPLMAPPHESFMDKVTSVVHSIGNVAGEVATAVPKIGSAIYNSVKSARILQTLRNAGPIIEEIGEAAPLLLA